MVSYNGILHINQMVRGVPGDEAVEGNLSRIVGFEVTRESQASSSNLAEIVDVNGAWQPVGNRVMYVLKKVRSAVHQVGVPRAIVVTDDPLRDRLVKGFLWVYARILRSPIHFSPREELYNQTE